jgi:hypothetical protein
VRVQRRGFPLRSARCAEAQRVDYRRECRAGFFPLAGVSTMTTTTTTTTTTTQIERDVGADFAAVMGAKRAVREAAIEKLRGEAKARGQMADRSFWSMVYDFEMAPMTTNRKQLAEIGIECPMLGESLDAFSDSSIASLLKDIIDGMARLNIFLLHTNHLSDRALLARLVKDILDEEVRDLPVDGAAKEFVDLCIPETDEEWEIYQRTFYSGDKPTNGVERDSTLPKPDGFSSK